MKQWRQQLGQKFTKLPGIRSLHDFVTIRHPISGDVIMHVQQLCYIGAFEPKKKKLAIGVHASLDAIPTEVTTNAQTLLFNLQPKT